MGRVVPIVVCVLIVAVAWFTPQASTSYLSANEAYELLALPASGPGIEEGDEIPLWQVVVESEAARVVDDGRLQVLLHGVTHQAIDEEYDPLSPTQYATRRSLVRGLRQYLSEAAEDPEVLAAHPEYARLVISGEQAPASNWGANFLITYDGSKHAAAFYVDVDGKPPVEPFRAEREWHPPSRASIVPPLVAVILAILLRKPIVALLVAVFSGAFLIARGDGGSMVGSVTVAARDVVLKYFKNELVDTERAYIIGFVFFMLAMVGVMTRAGGIRGLMDAVARMASSARKTQVATWLMGLVIFFDDYANTILVGSTMRPLTDRFRISREKLSYIVDSTAAPVAGLSIFSTWIAFEVSTFNQQLPAAGLSPDDGYAIFIRTIPFSFYCFLTIYFVGLVALTGRDFGPMRTAELRARRTGALLRPGATPMVSEEATAMEAAPHVTPRAWRAVAPLLAFIVVTMYAIFDGGGFFELPADERFTIEGITAVLYDGSGSWPLLVGSIAGFAVAAGAALMAGLTSDVLTSAWTTVRAMAVGFAILYLAWMIGAVCSDLGTAPFLTAVVGDDLPGHLLPSILFLLAGCVAFATGSSWSTMSILLPLVVGVAYHLGVNAYVNDGATYLGPNEIEAGRQIMVMSIGAVLSGAIFGDHCSPISDTTVMSSIASASDHIDHVKTQVPYSLTVALTSVVFGYFPATYFDVSPWLLLAAACAFLTFLVFVFGKRVEVPAT